MQVEERSMPALPWSDDAGELVTPWLTIDQERVTAFGRETLDPDPLHIDPAYAAAHGPYGRTISFGFLTVSLLTYFHHSVMRHDQTGYALNYGFDRLRLPQVVLVGSRLRGVFRHLSNEERGPGRTLMRYDVRVEIEGEPKPALSAEWLAMWVDDGVRHPPPPLAQAS